MASTTHVELLERSPNMRRTLEYVAALNEWNYDKIIDCFDDTLEHRILPASLGRPVRDKALYKEWFSSIFPNFKEFKVSAHCLWRSMLSCISYPQILINKFELTLPVFSVSRLQFTSLLRVAIPSSSMHRLLV